MDRGQFVERAARRDAERARDAGLGKETAERLRAEPVPVPVAAFVSPRAREAREAARAEAMARHPAGRALAGRFTQSHPWLTGTSEAGRGELVELRERVERLERRLRQLETAGSHGIEVTTFDGQTRTIAGER
ncbi:hypothetical protein [Planomonospora sp. ID82291]|uniref:hypothetical protein n=1 Tax=Planomonospora sp. ID82291 TaxID=2738136 RepID=UPI0018C3B03A|nr:hypothetical protein [Planomonospora sp. ID82291]MBG0818900.1 hypothetical protein [Planomonospora sp. ID82291]